MKLTEEQRRQFEEQTRIGVWTRYLAIHAENNTGFIPKGQQFAKQLRALAEILDRQKHHFITTIFDTMNIKEATVNVETGELKDIVLKDV